jgi:hypothetical protein
MHHRTLKRVETTSAAAMTSNSLRAETWKRTPGSASETAFASTGARTASVPLSVRQTSSTNRVARDARRLAKIWENSVNWRALRDVSVLMAK